MTELERLLLELFERLIAAGLILVYSDDLVITHEAREIVLSFIENFPFRTSNWKADFLSGRY